MTKEVTAFCSPRLNTKETTMTELFANPYDTSVTGFHFTSNEEYQDKSSKLINDYGHPIEEFEIEFIEGDLSELFSVCNITQCTLDLWFDDIESLTEPEQTEIYYRCDQLGEATQQALNNINSDGYIFSGSALDYALEYINDLGIIDCIPESIQRYFNHEAYARDLELNGCITEFSYNNEKHTASGF